MKPLPLALANVGCAYSFSTPTSTYLAVPSSGSKRALKGITAGAKVFAYNQQFMTKMDFNNAKYIAIDPRGPVVLQAGQDLGAFISDSPEKNASELVLLLLARSFEQCRWVERKGLKDRAQGLGAHAKPRDSLVSFRSKADAADGLSSVFHCIPGGLASSASEDGKLCINKTLSLNFIAFRSCCCRVFLSLCVR